MDELITKENYELLIKLQRAFKTRGYEVATSVTKQDYAVESKPSYDHPLPSFVRIVYNKDGMVFQYETQKQKRVVPVEYLTNENWKKDAKERDDRRKAGIQETKERKQ